MTENDTLNFIAFTIQYDTFVLRGLIMTKIKYCVWDVGNVIYDYTITPLNDWCEQHTTDKETFKKNKGKFSYDNYMKGLIPFPQLCQEICEFYGVPSQQL